MKCEAQTYISVQILDIHKKKKIKKCEEKMVQVFEKPDLREIIEQEEIFVVIPENITDIEKEEELRPKKKSKVLKYNKYMISIDKVKRNLDTKLYYNRFPIY
ncbi:MAG: hypothetical protein ACFFFT_12475 [Candidatus Thorarchaeota archaeon]